MRSGDVATTDGGGAAQARVSERSAGRPPVASAKVSVKGLGLGLRARSETTSSQASVPRIGIGLNGQSWTRAWRESSAKARPGEV